MNRKKYLTESIEDFGRQIVNNVYDTLTQWDYEQSEIDSIVGRDSIELDITDGECVLHCGNEVIYSTPSNVLIHKFAPAAEEALLNWCIKKIGREPESLDADDLFGDIPGWNNLNEAYGTDFEDTLAWVQKKFPNKSEKEQHQFAKNIMKRYVAPDETNSTDVVEKPKTRKNVKLIKIIDIPNHGRHQDVYCKSLLLRTARKPGDTERVNHTVLGRLNAAGVKYEIIDENVNKNMSKKNTIRLTESDLKRAISESVKKVLKEGFNSPLPSFAAKEVEPKHRLRKQWDDDYDAMVARNHARGEEFMDDFNKKANLSYGKSLKEGHEDPDFTNEFEEIGNALNRVRQDILGKYAWKCQHYPNAYAGMEERLEEIRTLVEKAFFIASGYDKTTFDTEEESSYYSGGSEQRDYSGLPGWGA